MAQNYQPTSVGLRLARHGMLAGLSAAALADLIPSPRITRAVISNIESGRKADPSFSEVALIASGLRISPLDVLVDTLDPWAALDFDGLAGPLDGMTGLEYLSATNVLDIRSSSYVSYTARGFIDALNRAEDALHRRNILQVMRRDGLPAGIREGEHLSEQSPSGCMVPIDLGELAFPDPSLDDDQEVIDAYREALEHLHGRFARDNISRTPKRIDDRLERLRLAVVDFIAASPGLDYGQVQRSGVLHATPLDPQTGRLTPEVRPSNA